LQGPRRIGEAAGLRKIFTAAFLFFTVHPAFGYQVRRSGSGAPLRWSDGTIPVELALDQGPAGIATDEAVAAATEAFARYQRAIAELAPGIAVVVHARAGAPPAPSTRDRVTTVRWVDADWDDDYDPVALAVTVMSYDDGSGRIEDADIVINAARYPWSTSADPGPACGGFDLQDVLTHEVGHLFGLAHDPTNVDATMYASADACETKKRELHPPDLEGLRYLYVDVGPAPAGCAVGGRSGPPGWSALALVAGLLALRWRRAALLALLIAAPAHATLVRRLGLDEMGRAATLIVEGHVRTTDVVERGDRVYTEAQLEVSACWKGLCPATLTVRQLGGEVAGRGMAVEGAAELRAGADVVLFLRPRRDGAYAPVGLAQGAYTVEREGLLARDLRGLGFAGERVHGGIERIRRDELDDALRRAR
jgi:hypothetical protein